ncbi:monocarboxylate transporter 2-like [Chaetodon auriga]|uniref:monocarboxylate transporter 2-like n=1 Tax=Chaetodon auriga TaxID=39042 RepID=UPI0040331424
MSPAPADELDYKPRDGGWGWVVVFGAHISIGFAYSTSKVLSIFFSEIQEQLESSTSEVAWISSIMLASMYAGGPVSSVLVGRFGSRPIAMLGGVMCAVSMATASVGNSIIFLYLCIGVIAGCGLSFNLNASLTIISKYFLVKRPLANGLAMAGSPVFQSVMAPVNQYLLDSFGWRGSLLILGGLMLNCCVAGALMRPVSVPCKPSSSALRTKAEEQPNNSKTTLKESCLMNVKKFLDFSFFKDRGFVIYLCGNMLFIFGAYSPIMFLQAYAVSKGVDEYSAAYLLSIMGLVDMFVRPSTGLVANSKWIRPRIQYLFSIAMIFNGTTHLLCPLMESYAFLVVYAVLYGMSFGMVFALIFECLMDLMGNERFPSAVGLVTIMECFPMLVGPPAAGLLVDIFGDYDYLFIMCGAVISTGGLFLFVMNIYNYHMLKKEGLANGKEQNQKTTDNQDEVEMKQTPEPEMGQTGPEDKNKNGVQRDPYPENVGTPN